MENKHRKPWVIAITLFLIGLIVGGATVSFGLANSSSLGSTVTVTAQNGSSGPKLKVLATFFPLQDWGATVGGNKANVSLLVPVGTDVHDFEPGPVKR